MAASALDASLFTAGSEAQRVYFAAQLADGLKKRGFITLCNHGLSHDIITAVFAWNNRFFNLPLETKMKIAYNGGSAPARGYSTVGREKTWRFSPAAADLTDANDAKECLDIGPRSDTAFPTPWLDEALLPGFRQCMESYYATCQAICLWIMQALEIGMELPRGSLTERSVPDSSELRLNHYPEIGVQEQNVSRIWPHTDIGIITLLLQDRAGLEVEDRQNPGSFLSVSSDDTTNMIISTGDTFERWTNGMWQACLHQVPIVKSMDKKVHGMLPVRKSIAFFLKASISTSAGPLPHFVSAEASAQYDEISALEYLQRKHRTLYPD